jgi:hypothetical protein
MLGSIIFGTTSLAGIGLAAFLIGLLTLYLPSQLSVTPELVEAYSLSSLENVERFLREFASESKARYLKVKDRSDPLIVFIPVDDNPTSYPADRENYDQLLVVNPDNPHSTGLFLEAPGASLLRLMEKESGVDFFDVSKEGLLETLRAGLVESLEVAADVKGAFHDNHVKLRIREGLVAPSRSTKLLPTTLARLGCPVCSAAICAVVKATKTHALVEAIGHDGKYHNITLILGGSENEAH